MAEQSELEKAATERASATAGLHARETLQEAISGQAERVGPPVQLRTQHDLVLATTALKQRAGELRKLASKPREQGYLTEARAIEADADAIEQFLMPQFREQQELGLEFTENLQAALRSTCRTLVDTALWSMSAQADDEDQMTPAQREGLSKQLASKVVEYALEVSSQSYQAGFAARAMTPEAIAYRALPALR